MITITLPLPPTANRNWQTFNNRVIKSKRAVDYTTEVRWMCRERNVEPLTGNIIVILDAYFPSSRHDLDNVFKVVFDALNGFVWHDDKQVYEICATKHIDKKNPRVELTARVIEGED